MSEPGDTERTRIRRAPQRAVNDTRILHEIIDSAYICHVGFTDGDYPVVIPTLGWRVNNRVYFHGSRGSRMLKVFKNGGKACLTFTLLDGFVMARSAFHHSANYRSAMVFGRPELVEDKPRKLELLKVFLDQIAPGRWEQLRETTPQEIEATDVLGLDLSETSVKVRAGDPVDDEADLAHPVWAGVISAEQKFGPVISSADNLHSELPPDYRPVFGQRWHD